MKLWSGVQTSSAVSLPIPLGWHAPRSGYSESNLLPAQRSCHGSPRAPAPAPPPRSRTAPLPLPFADSHNSLPPIPFPLLRRHSPPALPASSGLPSHSPSTAVLPSPPSPPALCTPAISPACIAATLLHQSAVRSLSPHIPPAASLHAPLPAPPPPPGPHSHAAPAHSRSLPTRSDTLSPSPAGPLSR